MDDLSATLIEGLESIEDAVGSIVTWNGGNYPCVGGSEKGGKLLDLGGFTPMADVQLIVRTAVLPDQATRPKEKQSVTYLSTPGAIAKPLRIQSLTLLYDQILVLDCIDPSQHA